MPTNVETGRGDDRRPRGRGAGNPAPKRDQEAAPATTRPDQGSHLEAEMSLWGNFTTIKNQVKSLKQVADLIAGRAPGPKPNNPLMRQPPVTVPEEEGREQMPCVTFAGVFSERRSYGKFLRHSGLVTVDYENLKDRNKTPEGWKNRAAGRMPGLAMAFTTPSKDGVKLVIQVHPKPAGKEEHQLAFLRAVQELEKLGMEGWNCNGQDMRAVSFLPRDTRIQLSDGVEPLRWSAG